MLDFPVSVRITGAADASGRVGKLSTRALKELKKAAEVRAQKTKDRFQTEMAREYTSAYATGQLARGITYRAFQSGNGVDVKFFIQDRRELRYLTAALGGHFQRFPVGPFVIQAQEGRSLRIPLAGPLARQFIRGKKGRFTGSRGGGAIYVKKVLWGNKTGGFSRDVISEVAEQEGALFVKDVQAAVGIAIQAVTG